MICCRRAALYASVTLGMQPSPPDIYKPTVRFISSHGLLALSIPPAELICRSVWCLIATHAYTPPAPLLSAHGKRSLWQCGPFAGSPYHSRVIVTGVRYRL